GGMQDISATLKCVAQRSTSGFRLQYPSCSLGDDIAVAQRSNLVDVPPHNDLAARILPIPIISTNTRGWEHLVRKKIVLPFFIGIYKDDVRLDEFTDIGISFFSGHHDWDDQLSISAQVMHRQFENPVVRERPNEPPQWANILHPRGRLIDLLLNPRRQIYAPCIDSYEGKIRRAL